jgi:hypothetical protein
VTRARDKVKKTGTGKWQINYLTASRQSRNQKGKGALRTDFKRLRRVAYSGFFKFEKLGEKYVLFVVVLK